MLGTRAYGSAAHVITGWVDVPAWNVHFRHYHYCYTGACSITGKDMIRMLGIRLSAHTRRAHAFLATHWGSLIPTVWQSEAAPAAGKASTGGSVTTRHRCESR